MPYPSALGAADEPLAIEWPADHSYAVVATGFHGGAVLGKMATEDEAWEIYDQWPETDCWCRRRDHHPGWVSPQARWESTKDARRLTPDPAGSRFDKPYVMFLILLHFGLIVAILH